MQYTSYILHRPIYVLNIPSLYVSCLYASKSLSPVSLYGRFKYLGEQYYNEITLEAKILRINLIPRFIPHRKLTW